MKHLFIAFIFLTINAVTHAQPEVGSKAPDISLPDSNGEVIALSSLKGKIVLLDFWASWCGPCRKNNHEMLPLYQKYKDKGFEIFGVSLDANKDAWTNALQKDKMTWLHVIDTKAATGNKLTRTWNLQYIPSTFLIDKEGKIIAVSPEKDELEKLLENLLK